MIEHISNAAALTVKEFCERVRIGKTFFYQEVKARRINVVKAGRKTLIPATEVQAWLERLETPAR